MTETATLKDIAREPNRMLRSGRPILSELVQNHAITDEGVRYMLASGADPLLQDADGNRPAAFAVLYGKADILKTLVEAAGPETVNHKQGKSGTTLLHIAASNSGYDIVPHLLAAGAIVNLENAQGETPLLMAVRAVDVKMVRLLLQAGADVEKYERKNGVSLIKVLETATVSDHYAERARAIRSLLQDAGAKPLPKHRMRVPGSPF